LSTDDIELAAPLAAWLAPVLGVGEVEVGNFERPSAGQSSDTRLFTATWPGGSRELVLRRQQQGSSIFLQPDVVREARVLRGLEVASRVPVPHVLAQEPDPGVLGAPFFVMERVHGRAPTARPSPHVVGWLPTLSAAERSRLWRSGIETLVAIHEVDWRASHAFLAADGEAGGLEAHVERVVEWYRWTTAGRAFPVTDAAVDEVVRRHGDVETGDPVLVWGDARPGNMLFGDDNRVAAAIDWEVATIGPAGVDLGHWLFFDAFATVGAGVDPLPGWPDRQATIAAYEVLSGRRIDAVDLFELLEELFIATTLIRQADMRVEKGLAPPDTRMGHDNAVTQLIARRLGLAVPALSEDYLAHRSGR
jgi:aminoglycoside phosphotransferase (APT) family kinase protein